MTEPVLVSLRARATHKARPVVLKGLRRLARTPIVERPFRSLWFEHDLCLHLLPDRLRLQRVPLSSLFPGADSVGITVDVLPEGGWSTNLVDLVLLLKIVRLTSPRRVLELGSYRGTTAAYLARTVPEGGAVVAIDIDPSHGSMYRGTELESRIERRVGSIGPGLFVHDPPGSYDLVFVDASHKYEDVRRDTEIALSLVASDGHVVWHDYSNFGYFNGGCEVPEVLHDLARTKPVVHLEGSALALHSPAWPGTHLSS